MPGTASRTSSAELRLFVGSSNAETRRSRAWVVLSRHRLTWAGVTARLVGSPCSRYSATAQSMLPAASPERNLRNNAGVNVQIASSSSPSLASSAVLTPASANRSRRYPACSTPISSRGSRKQSCPSGPFRSKLSRERLSRVVTGSSSRTSSWGAPGRYSFSSSRSSANWNVAVTRTCSAAPNTNSSTTRSRQPSSFKSADNSDWWRCEFRMCDKVSSAATTERKRPTSWLALRAARLAGPALQLVK